MAIPQVKTQALNLGQGSTPEIERKVLFIGVADGSALAGAVFLSSDSDLDDLMGESDSELKTHVEAAILSAGTGFEAAYIEISNFAEWPAALEVAMETFSPELVAVCTPITDKSDLSDAQVTAVEQTNTLERLVTVCMTSPGITNLQSWPDYVTAQALFTDSLACDRVVVVPDLCGNNLGALVGRLAKKEVSIADSPIRKQTGPDIALAAFPVDKDGKSLTLATLTALHNTARLTVPFWFTDVQGIFWTDCLTLDAVGGDFQLVQHRRVVDKASRAIRLLTINEIGNRQFNQTETSIKLYQGIFEKPLRDMSKSVTVNGKAIPGEIKLPNDAVTIQWVDADTVKIYYKLTPYKSVTEIINNVFLDLSNA